MIRFLMYSIALMLALVVSGVLGYLVLSSPMWLFGQEPESMILWGWISGLAGMIVAGLAGFGIFYGMHKLIATIE